MTANAQVIYRGRRGRADRMVVGFTTTCATVPVTTNVVSSNPANGEVYLIKDEVLLTVGCTIFPPFSVSIHTAKYLFTGSFKNRLIDI